MYAHHHHYLPRPRTSRREAERLVHVAEATRLRREVARERRRLR